MSVNKNSSCCKQYGKCGSYSAPTGACHTQQFARTRHLQHERDDFYSSTFTIDAKRVGEGCTMRAIFVD